MVVDTCICYMATNRVEMEKRTTLYKIETYMFVWK